MTVYQWVQVLAFAGGVIERAVRIVLALRSDGCAVEGCPVEVERLMPADIPREGRATVAAMDALARRASGLDRASIRAGIAEARASGLIARGRRDLDELERRTRPEHPDAAEVYGEDDDDGA